MAAAAASSVVGGLLSSSSPLGQQQQTRKCSFLSSQFLNDLPISLRPFSSSSSSSSSRRCTRCPRIRSSLQSMVSDMGRKAPEGLFPPEPEKYTGPKLGVAIIGAGLAGMSTAVELLDQGHEVDIYEARSFIGGKVGSYVDKNRNHIEMGLHVFFGWYNNLFRLLTKALRFLAALVLGFGVMLSLRPGHALANVANEVFSPQGKGLLASAWAGLVAGGLHTLTGPDHLAALAPLCIGRSRIQSAAVGALWGCGHDAGQIIFGLIFLVLKDKLHIELIRTWASRVVGLTLITIGGVGIYESQEPVAVLAEESGMQDGGGDPTVRIKNDSKNATTFATGVVYGLQPDALLMILPALALPSRATGAAFLVMFLLGTILAMGSYTLFIASCSHALQKRLPGITKNLSVGSSIIAIALGLGLVASELFGFTIF